MAKKPHSKKGDGSRKPRASDSSKAIGLSKDKGKTKLKKGNDNFGSLWPVFLESEVSDIKFKMSSLYEAPEGLPPLPAEDSHKGMFAVVCCRCAAHRAA